MRRRRVLLSMAAWVVCLGGLGAPHGVLAQQPGKVWRIGFLGSRSRSTPANPDAYYDAFVDGLRELGYAEGKNLVIEWRFADGKYELLPALAAELVRWNPDVIVTQATPATDALKHATGTIPIVFIAVGDPVGRGFATTLAKPGGNTTGTSVMDVDLIPKHLELLKTMVPELSRVAALVNPGNAAQPAMLKSARTTALQIGVSILPVEARTPEEVERGFAAMKRDHADGVLILVDPFFIGQRRQIAGLAARNRLPSMFDHREAVQAGGLMSYGPNLTDSYRHTATYVDKILKGAKPGELPIEQPNRIHLAINRKTANVLGLTIPQELLLRTDEVIE
jgi:putative tryptophan/tyrosine transport system substrate-binding protein